MCRFERSGLGWCVRGTVLTHDARQPIEIRYAVTVDSTWATTDVAAQVAIAGGDPRDVAELSTLWSGKTRLPEYRNCLDVDLSFTPATNTLPIRRLGLGVGDEAEIEVAWLLWPELSVRPARQVYPRLAEHRYRYTQDDFTAELVTDGQGLILEYEGLWRAIARA